MWRIRMLVGLGALAAGTASLGVSTASAANSPTFRDCSLAGGLDADFVQLSGVTVGPQGIPTVPAGQRAVKVLASESNDPGDKLAHDTFKVTVTAPGGESQSVSGEGTGEVLLSAPLRASGKVGRTYTIEWAAVFDNGMNACPGEFHPFNMTPNPFIVRVA